jgi:hypothetical protein
MNSETIGTTGKPSSKGALAAALSAVGSVLAVATCCLPVLPFVLAAGTAGTATFLSSFISTLRHTFWEFPFSSLLSGFIKADAPANVIANRVFSAKWFCGCRP